MVIGTQPSGQGHETSFAQVVADLIAVPVQAINVIIGDTDIVSVGGGSHSGRSMRHAGTVIVKAVPELIGKGQKIAALALGIDAGKIEFKDGRFSSQASNRSFDFLELAKEAERLTLPADLKGGLAVACDNEMHEPVFPERLRDLRDRDRSRHRAPHHHTLRRSRRRRPLHQSADRPRPDAWRHRAGRGPGDVGAVLR